MFQDRWIPLAKIYYTLEALGEEARLSPEVFTAIHGKGVSLWQDKTFFDWAASQGLDRKKVEDMYNSFAIAGKVNRARQAGAGVQDPIGAADRRRRQVRRPHRTQGAMPARSTRCRKRAPSDRSAESRRGRRCANARRSSARWTHRVPRPQRLHHRRQQRHRRGARAALRGAGRECRAVRAAAAPSSTRWRPTLPAGRAVALRRRRARRRARSRAPPPISSRASARPTSSSPTPASRAAR